MLVVELLHVCRAERFSESVALFPMSEASVLMMHLGVSEKFLLLTGFNYKVKFCVSVLKRLFDFARICISYLLVVRYTLHVYILRI